MPSPYEGLDDRAFWKHVPADPTRDIYRCKFPIGRDHAIATAGSCFAQHIARTLRGLGYRVLDLERPPREMPRNVAQSFGYGLYSARYGNIYTARQLAQTFREAYGRFQPQNWIWERGGRFFDALRPSVEPAGLSCPEEVEAHRRHHLGRVRQLLAATDVFVFTFGLTEAWRDRASGTVFPTAPGTIAGAFDPATFEFVNFTFADTLADFLGFRALVKRRRPEARFLVTVSPVPLTATASGDHVLPATVYSKSVLRAVAGELAATLPDVDYFPSYEIIAAHPARGAYYNANLRTVTDAGVEKAMSVFVSAHASDATAPVPEQAAPIEMDDEDDLVCEEVLLEAFAR
jgi:hypothetical protein